MSHGKIPMVGKTYGNLLVLADEPPHITPAGVWRRYVLVQCTCGSIYSVDAQRLRDGSSHRCLSCRNARNATRARARQSVKLANGRTVAQVAVAAGLPLMTVWMRHKRGWPDERLGEPIRAGFRTKARAAAAIQRSIDMVARRTA